MKTIPYLLLLLLPGISTAQLPARLEGRITYPVFDQAQWMGVIMTDSTSLNYDKSLNYKVMIDIYDETSDSARINTAIREAGRTYNLFIANGVPKEQLKMALIIHGGAVDAVLNDAAYTRKYGIVNPNTDLLNAFSAQGVKMYICGQSLGFMDIPPADLSAPVEVALSAKTAIVTLDQQGYSYLNVND